MRFYSAKLTRDAYRILSIYCAHTGEKRFEAISRLVLDALTAWARENGIPFEREDEGDES